MRATAHFPPTRIETNPAHGVASRHENGRSREDRPSANNMLEKLPPIESNLLKLRLETGLSQRSISAVVSIPQQTVSFRIKRAIRGLRKALSLVCFDQQIGAAAGPQSGANGTLHSRARRTTSCS